ncbi:MAG: PIN domain-containing protein [Alphaproteobacteria bacterium]
MPGKFFDTNILLYIVSSHPAKAGQARAIVREGGAISVQVLNEVTNVARRKMRLTWPEVHALLDLLRGLVAVHPLTIEVHEIGIALAERYGLQTWDAMIAASAIHARCDILWSEDMQNGQVLGNRLRVVDPFRMTS